nr:FecR domain-containing protein [Membranihabitans maritimus]
MFEIFEDRNRFESVYELFEQEWESKDVSFDLQGLSIEKVREDFEKNRQRRFVDVDKKKGSNRRIWSIGIAASIAVLLGVVIWYFNTGEGIIYETGYGETKEIVLEDKSTVKLNANSRLIWNKDWQDSGIRELVLDGEAFFDVIEIPDPTGESSNGNMPFRVVTPDLTVNVHGTSFNVVSRRQKTDVFLESGKVELELNEEKTGDKKNRDITLSRESLNSTSNTIVMKPGDAVTYSATDLLLEHIQNSTTRDHASWIEGDLAFENEHFETVLQRLEDIYGKQFEVKDTALLSRRVNLGLPYEDWATVSGLMTLTLEIDMEEVNGKIIVERKKGN